MMLKSMLLSLFVIIALILSSAKVFATEASVEISNQEAEEFVDLINKYQLMNDTAYSLNGTTVADPCIAFMNKSNVLGDLGKYISQELQTNSKNYSNLLNAPSLNVACPKYPKMNLQQRSSVITLLLTAMAHFESSCKIESSIKGPNGKTYGYWQLHLGKESRYDSQDICKINDSKKPAASARCVLSMLDDQVKRSKGEIFSRGSYWDVLRPQGKAKKAGAIRRTLQNFSLCKSLMT